MNKYKYIATIRRNCDENRFVSDTYYIRYKDGHESIGSTFVDHTVEDYWTECAGCECEDAPDCADCVLYKRIHRKLNDMIGE